MNLALSIVYIAAGVFVDGWIGIADAIHNHGKPMTLTELASSLKLHPYKVNVLYRLMRVLTHNGFFTKTTAKEETIYALTPPSKLLIRGKPMCLASLTGGHPRTTNMWNFTKKWLTEDKELSLFESANGETFWDMLNKDSESDNLSFFQEAMEADSQMFKLALKDCKHVFEGLETLVDVGGGTGVVAKLIHEVLPDIKCTVLDQPQVVGNLTGNKNLNFVGGDMFKFELCTMEKKERKKNGRNSYMMQASAATRLLPYGVSSHSLKFILSLDLCYKFNKLDL
ncbi:Isoflavone 4'-O-methyltransferase [Trifolium repens]|nr:Isoflavone 4'-O-methyltransferase [Trifolium repens]